MDSCDVEKLCVGRVARHCLHSRSETRERRRVEVASIGNMRLVGNVCGVQNVDGC
jgi:hypothetical protein